jgi:hypothetical protein
VCTSQICLLFNHSEHRNVYRTKQELGKTGRIRLPKDRGAHPIWDICTGANDGLQSHCHCVEFNGQFLLRSPMSQWEFWTLF